jgi:hypothetical protein
MKKLLGTFVPWVRLTLVRETGRVLYAIFAVPAKTLRRVDSRIFWPVLIAICMP